MGILNFVKGAAGAAVGAVQGVGKVATQAASALPAAAQTVATHVQQGATTGDPLQAITSHVSAASATSHPSGGTVLNHYVQAAGMAAVGMVLPHVPFVPTGIKTAASAALVTFAVARVDAAAKHLESAYVAPAAPTGAHSGAPA
jgi:hypothetical protein